VRTPGSSAYAAAACKYNYITRWATLGCGQPGLNIDTGATVYNCTGYAADINLTSFVCSAQQLDLFVIRFSDGNDRILLLALTVNTL
jgi:hypothetical protein